MADMLPLLYKLLEDFLYHICYHQNSQRQFESMVLLKILWLQVVHQSLQNSCLYLRSKKKFYSCFDLLEWMSSQRWESGNPVIRDFVSCPGNRTKSYFSGQGQILAPWLQGIIIKAGAWHENRQLRRSQWIGIQSALQGIWMRTLHPW